MVKISKTRTRYFVHFFAVTARLRRELPNFTFYRQREHTTTNLSYSYVMLIVKNRLRQLKRRSKLFLSTNTKKPI